MSEWLERILGIGSAWWESRLLLTAMELDVVGVLGEAGMTADEAASRLSTEPRATELLLNALVGLDLLRKDGDLFSPTAEAARSLDPSSPDFRGGMLRHAIGMWDSWSQLTDAVRGGGPAQRAERPDSGRDFMLAMHHNALQTADRIAELLDLTRATSLIDLGGGPGTYAIAFARANPQLRVTVLDAPYALEVAAENVAAAGLDERIQLTEGDFLTDDIGRGYDVAYGSHIIHSYRERENRELMGKIRRALAPGGRVVLHDFFLDDSRTEPAWAALFSLNMLVNSDGGRSYSASEVRGWIEDAGFGDCEQITLDRPSSLLVAR